MSDDLVALVPVYGLWLIGAATFLSCLAVPIPASLIMMTAGGFVASGDLVGWQVVTAGLVGALLGDQTGFQLGRLGGAVLVTRMEASPTRAALFARARALVDRHGGWGVFLSRWLFSPLAPYVTLLTGAALMNHARFTVAVLLGASVWVGLHVGLGWAFADRIVALGNLLGNLSGLLAAAAVTAVLGLRLYSTLRARNQRDGPDTDPTDS